MLPGSAVILVLVFFLAVLIDLFFVYRLRKKRSIHWRALSAPAEILIILGWAFWVASPLLNTPSVSVPYGGEFSNLVQTHFIWTLLPRCGLCVLWNGMINGGAPAFAELSGAPLHPLVMLPVLIWGVIQGSKVTFALGLALAGIAQWLLARKLGLGGWARLWSGLLIVVGGHLAGKMENAGIGLVLAQACAALALAFGVDLLFNRNRRALVGFSAALALTALAGEGYIQVAVALTLLPMLALFCLGRDPARRGAWKDYLLALGLASLLGGIFFVPLLHFLPQVGKEADTSLSNLQPLVYTPLNLVIGDLEFQHRQILGKDPYLATHLIYIGWAAVLLAILALRLAPRRLNRVLWAFLSGIGLVFLVTSRDLPALLVDRLPWVGGLRHFSVASGLAVPLVVGLAAMSLDEILRWVSERIHAHGSASPARQNEEKGESAGGWPSFERTSLIGFGAKAALVIPLAILSIGPCYRLSQNFMGAREIDYMEPLMAALQTRSAQWIQPPYAFYDWTAQALERGMKIGHTWRPWYWKGRADPESLIEAVYLPRFKEGEAPEGDLSPVGAPYASQGKYGFVLHSLAEYAYLVEDQPPRAQIPCAATSQGGWIDVACPESGAGKLIVRENAWEGWYSWVDEQPTPLLPGQWLSVVAAEGKHQYKFRYLPWDVAIGALASLAGIGLALWVYWKRKQLPEGRTGRE